MHIQKKISMILKTYLKKNLFKNNFLANLTFNTYSFIASKLENILFKKIKKNTKLLSDGHNLYKSKTNLKIEKYLTKKIVSNKYLSKIIFNDNDLKDLIYNLFVKDNICDLITSETGFNYSIDFFTAYETKHIANDDLELRWYANHWHKDKPFTKNTLKIIIPIENISKDHGGIEIKKSKDDKYIYKMISEKRDFFAFFPNRCFHKAGNPEQNLVRKQIMFQLNPAKQWQLNSKVFIRQTSLEPKFPLFTYMFDKKIELQKLN